MMRRQTFLGWLGLSVLSCTSVLGIDKQYREGAGGGGSSASATGSAGGGSASSSSSAPASGVGGASSASATSTSTSASGGCSCPPDPECATYSCVSNQCMLMNTTVGFLSNMQTPGDCLKRVCDGNGGVMVTQDTNDAPAGNACNKGSCLGGMPMLTTLPPGTACGQNQTCNGFGMCQQCSGAIPSCGDFCADMGESDTDCGAVCTAAGKLCAVGKHCFDKNDCSSNLCTNGICTP